MNIDVSIIVPCYNVESYVDNCLEALTAQTLHQMETVSYTHLRAHET